MLADEPLHALDRVAGIRRVRLSGHEAVIGPAIQLQLDLAAGLLPALDEPPHRLDRDPFVGIAAEYQRWRQIGLFAAVEDRRRAAFAHRRFVAPVGVMVLDQLAIAGLLCEM